MGSPRRCILGVFAHPDDETAGAGGTFARYAREGVEVYVVTATLGEEGSLGTEGYTVARKELPEIRERELRSALELIGARPPVLLGYRDQELARADLQEVVSRVSGVMDDVRPDVVNHLRAHRYHRA